MDIVGERRSTLLGVVEVRDNLHGPLPRRPHPPQGVQTLGDDIPLLRPYSLRVRVTNTRKRRPVPS